jgi:sodium/potassium-transporting ATPase subunit alpha
MIRGGDNTVIGQIASLTSGEERRESPLSVEIDNFVKIIASVAAIVAIIFFIISIRIYSVSAALTIAIGTFIAFVPEGLPATVSVSI